MIFLQTFDGVGEDGAYRLAEVGEVAAQGGLDGLGEAANEVELHVATAAALDDCGQRAIVPIVQRCAYHLGTVALPLVMHREGGQRSEEAVGVGLVIDGINQLGIAHGVNLMEHVS